MKGYDTYGSCHSHASRDKVVGRGFVCGQHAKLAFVDEVDQVLDFGTDISLVNVGLLVRIGWLVASRGVGERH